uniref:Uncharacterized protein n=1 Tax=Cacopsylla melanoneura TaxID=428564 RepID=A0A8D8R025_9HEMI
MGQERIVMNVVALNGKEKTTMDIVALGKEKTSMDIVALGKVKTSMNIVALRPVSYQVPSRAVTTSCPRSAPTATTIPLFLSLLGLVQGDHLRDSDSLVHHDVDSGNFFHSFFAMSKLLHWNLFQHFCHLQ